MALTVNLDTQANADLLVAKHAALLTEYAALTSSASVSDQGRSINNGQTASALQAQMKAIREQLALMAGPVFTLSRMRT